MALILRMMEDRELSLRKIAGRTGIGKTRLGLVLHRRPERRVAMTLAEFRAILNALEIDVLHAIITVETIGDDQSSAHHRHAALIAMLCRMFRGLAANVIDALEEVEGIDGSEVRTEWAEPLRGAVVKRLVHEISQVARRRSNFGDMSIFT